MKKVIYTKDGATKPVDADNKEVIAVLEANGWQAEKPKVKKAE